MKQLDENLVQQMTDRLVNEFHPEQVILFGSHAWGTPSEDSDIDLFVVVSESEERPLQRARRASNCLAGIRAPKDVLVRTRSEADKYRQVYASLESEIFEKGRVVYERR